jgi:hypothetical protein
MRVRMLAVLVGLIVGLVAAPPGMAAPTGPDLYVRQFCQTEDGFVVYIAGVATGLPQDATISLVVSPIGEFPFEIDPDERGRFEFSVGLGLMGLDDPLLGQAVIVRLTVNGVTVSEELTLTCDPTENAPANRQECAFEVFRFFFANLGYPFANQGDCVSYVATEGRNPPAASPT